jgi:hypothetical protein
MNDSVKASVDSRKTAIYNAYDINKDDVKAKVEDLFKRIEEFAATCSDSMNFETKFASNPLNQEYIEIFTFVATNCPTKLQPVTENAASDVKYMVDDLSSPMRHQAYQATYDAARDVPVLGEVMTAKQHFDFFSRFKRKKEDKNEEKDAE